MRITTMSFQFLIVLKRLALVLTLMPLAAGAQTSTATDPFEAKLADFKYSNYARFSMAPLISAQGQPDTGIAGKVSAFIAENQQEIRQYKIRRLENHLQDRLDLSAYTPEENPENTFAHTLTVWNGDELFTGTVMASLADLFKIEPDKTVLSAANPDYLLTLRKNDVPLAEIGLRAGLAAPKLRTVRIREGIYQIACDFYSRIYVVDYRLDDNTFMNPRIFNRTDAGPNTDPSPARTDQK